MDSHQAKIFSAAGKAQKHISQEKHICLVPGCTENTISSHSQQRGGQLKAIAEDGHVYAVEKNIYKNLKRGMSRGTIHYESTPIKLASVFPGYCKHHDSLVFKPIELTPLEVDNPEQAALLLLRAHSFELLQKKRVHSWTKKFIAESKHLLTQEVLRVHSLKMRGIEEYLKIDAPYYLNNAFKSITSNQYKNIQSAWVEIPKNLQVSVSCCLSPLLNHHIDYMSENQDEVQPSVSFSVIPNDNSTHVVVSWFKTHSKLAYWFKEALADKRELELLINQCVFGESEDTCLSPSLWTSLSTEEQTMIKQAVGFTRELELPAPLPRVVKL